MGVMRFIAPVIILGCAGLPAPPQGRQCVLNGNSSYGYCCPLPQTHEEVGTPPPAEDCYVVELETLHNAQCFDQPTWTEIMAYRKLLEFKITHKRDRLNFLEDKCGKN